MLDAILEQFEFGSMIPVDEVDGLLALRKRPVPGVYVLQFANGEYYVGQSTNVRARFRQHVRDHRDLVAATWKTLRYPVAVRQRMLLDEEQRMIDAFCHALRPHGIETRGIARVPMPGVRSQLADYVDYSDLAAFETNPDIILDEYPLEEVQPCSSRLQRRFDIIRGHDKYSEFRLAVREYLCRILLRPRSTAPDLWVASCMPGGAGELWLRINVGWQTTLDVLLLEGELFFDFYVSEALVRTHLEIENASDLSQDEACAIMRSEELGREYEITFLPCELVAGGSNQLVLRIEGAENVVDFLRHRPAIRMLRQFSLGLMLQGKSPSPQTHCAPLAHDLFEGNPRKPWW